MSSDPSCFSYLWCSEHDRKEREILIWHLYLPELISVFQVLLELLLTELCPELRAHLEQLNAT